MTKLLAFDTSLTATGYSLYVDGELKEYGVITGEKTGSPEQRFEKMVSDIYKMIQLHNPAIVVTELTSVARNVDVQRKLTMLLGTIWGLCLLEGIYYHSFRPSEWRRLVDSEKKPTKRAELKKWSMDKASAFAKAEIDNDNTADAVLIGLAYIKLFS